MTSSNKSASSIGAINTASVASFRLMLLAAMVIQNSSVVLVGRYTRSSTAANNMFIVSHFILVTEVSKVRHECEAHLGDISLRNLVSFVLNVP